MTEFAVPDPPEPWEKAQVAAANPFRRGKVFPWMDHLGATPIAPDLAELA